MIPSPAERSSEVGAALKQIVREHGPAALSDPRVMSGLLQDLLPEASATVRMLVAAAEDRVAEMLLEHVGHGLDAQTAARLAASSFAHASMFAPEACAWAVDEIATALALRPGDQVTTPQPGAHTGSLPRPPTPLPATDPRPQHVPAQAWAPPDAALPAVDNAPPRAGAWVHQPVGPAAPGWPSTPAPPAPPMQVVVAVRLMALGAVLTGAAVIAIAIAYAISVAHGQTQPPTRTTREMLLAAAAAGILAVLVSPWLLIMRACNRGRPWGRLAGTVLFALFTVDFVWIEQFDPPLARTAGVLLFWLIAMTVVILLWLKNSRYYFRYTKDMRKYMRKQWEMMYRQHRG